MSNRILLLDEHVAALDPRTAGFVLELTRRIIEEQKLTALMVTHSMRHALALGDRTLMLHGGRIVLDVAGEERRRMTVAGLIARPRAAWRGARFRQLAAGLNRCSMGRLAGLH